MNLSTARTSPRRLRRAAALALVAAAVPAASAHAASPIRERAVSFEVKNVNRSLLPCATDGATYTIRGHLVGTAQQLRSKRVSLYLHGLGFGEFFWRYQPKSRLDYAAGLAKRGHASVVIDRLGYGTSDKPAGTGSCIGGQADIAHQIVGQLRSGRYTGAGSPSFGKVALIGHSVGGQISELEAASFKDVDAAGVLAYADKGASATQMQAAMVTKQICDAGGQKQKDNASGPGGYALLGQTKDDARVGFYTPSDPKLFDAVFPLTSRNPCGDLGTTMPASELNLTQIAGIRVPVLVVQGGRDALFPSPAGKQQAGRFTGSRKVTYRSLARTPHALTFGAGRAQLQADVSHWLDDSGL